MAAAWYRQRNQPGDSTHQALSAMHVEGDDDFNKWSSRLAQEQADAGQCILFVNIKKLRPVRSRIEELVIVP